MKAVTRWKYTPVVLLVGMIIACGSGTSGETDTKSGDKPAAAPTTPKGKLQAAINESDVAKAKVVGYTDEPSDTVEGETIKVAEVRFPIGDRFSNESIRNGIGSDTFAIAGAAVKSKVPFDELWVTGTFDMQDKYGKELPNQQVYRAAFKRSELTKINYENIPTDFENVEEFTVDNVVFLHPAFRGE